MRIAIMGLAIALTACAQTPASRAKEAEAQFDLVTKHGSQAERCEAARYTRDSYLGAHDERSYKRWHDIAEAHCAVSAAVSFPG